MYRCGLTGPASGGPHIPRAGRLEVYAPARRQSLANIFKGGAHLVRRMPSLAAVTAVSALLEPFLPDRGTFERTLRRSSWDSLVAMFDLSNLPFTVIGAGLMLFQALLACWLTKKRLRGRGRAGVVGMGSDPLRRALLMDDSVALRSVRRSGVSVAYLLSVLVFRSHRLPKRSCFLAWLLRSCHCRLCCMLFRCIGCIFQTDTAARLIAPSCRR